MNDDIKNIVWGRIINRRPVQPEKKSKFHLADELDHKSGDGTIERNGEHDEEDEAPRIKITYGVNVYDKLQEINPIPFIDADNHREETDDEMK